MRRSIPVLLLCCLTAVALSAHAANRHIAGAANLPFSNAVVSGDYIYVAGMGGNDENADIGTQTQQTLANIAAALKKAGASLNDVVFTQVYLSNAANASGLDDAYAAAFKKNAPARVVIVTPSLVGGKSLVEINAVAVRHGVAHRAVLPKGWQKPPGPFSYGVKAGNTLYISGMTGRNPVDGSAAPSNAGAQTKAIMDNIEAVLHAGGMTLNDVAEGRIWLSDMKYYRDVNDVYRVYFVRDFPARATLQLRPADPADLLEISAVAVRGARHVIAGAIQDDGKQGKPNPNYSAGVAVGNRMWVTGMTGVTADDKDDVGAQAKETLTRMLRVLKAGHFTPEQVVAVNVYMHDVGQFTQMNAGYREIFTKNPPTRTTVQAENAGHSLVEIVILASR